MTMLINNISGIIRKFGISFYRALFNVVVYIAQRFWRRESGSTGSEEEAGPNSMPRGSAQDSHPVQGTCEGESIFEGPLGSPAEAAVACMPAASPAGVTGATTPGSPAATSPEKAPGSAFIPPVQTKTEKNRSKEKQYNRNKKIKKVRFASGTSLVTVHPVMLNHEYRRARHGPWEQMARDKREIYETHQRVGACAFYGIFCKTQAVCVEQAHGRGVSHTPHLSDLILS